MGEYDPVFEKSKDLITAREGGRVSGDMVVLGLELEKIAI
jgi:hypothetical protein